MKQTDAPESGERAAALSTDVPYSRSPHLLSRQSSRLLIVDVQEKLIPHIPVAEGMMSRCAALIRAARLFDIPVEATEQYRRGLGETVEPLCSLLPARPDKLRFSCAEVINWPSPASDPQCRDQVVVAGIETHVCILQTALDLLSAGFRVYVPADAVASRKKLDWKMALRRLSDNGATVMTTESVLFEWAEVAGTDEFREISRLVKELG